MNKHNLRRENLHLSSSKMKAAVTLFLMLTMTATHVA